MKFPRQSSWNKKRKRHGDETSLKEHLCGLCCLLCTGTRGKFKELQWKNVDML